MSKFNVRKLLLQLIVASFFTAFMYLLGIIPPFRLPFVSVPFVLQNIGPFLAGSVLGGLGVLSVVLLLLLAAAGFPVLPGARGGIAVFMGPTGGFLIGYALTALVVGMLVYRSWPRLSMLKFFFINLLGIIVMYIPGIAWYAFTTNTPLLSSTYLMLAFLPVDIIKIALASYIALKIKQFYPMINKTDVEDSTYEHSRKHLTID